MEAANKIHRNESGSEISEGQMSIKITITTAQVETFNCSLGRSAIIIMKQTTNI